MPVKSMALLGAFLLCFLFDSGNNGSPGEEVLQLYRKADKLFNLDNPTDATDSLALVTFRQVIQLLEKNRSDSLLFQSWLKTGVLLDVKTRFAEAKNAYLHAIRAHKHTRDSALFLPYVYTGTAYYHLNNFDSANYYLLQAETISNQFSQVPEKDRLYNALGALYYENGNYLQSRNYFSRALEIIRTDRPADKESAIHFEGNIAASDYRLGLYEQSLAQYEKLLSQHLYTSQISINMGKAYTLLGNYARAMVCFRRVDPKELPGVYNEMANAQLLAGNADSAALYLDQFLSYYEKNPGRTSKLDVGINHVYRSDWLNAQKQYRQALASLQKAIIIFSGSFHNEDIHSNPGNFAGSFASYRLFDALFRKARSFESLYAAEPQNDYLLAAFNTYQHTINLLRYIEKSYDTDDAKIFLKKNSEEVYQHAFLVCMQLREKFPEDDYLEKAFLVTEKNKASVMAARLTENRLKKIRGIDPALLQEERNVKYNIARLNIKSEGTQDKTELETIAREKEHYEIELSRLQKKIEQNSSYYKSKYAENFPAVDEIKKHISDDQAIISFYATDSILHVFAISKSGLHYRRIDSLSALRKHAEDWIEKLQTTEGGRRFNAGQTGEALYERLVKPLQQLAPEKEWVLIPDDIFYYLPFESLPAGEGPLLESTVISYHFSTRFLVQDALSAKPGGYEILSMAPFSLHAFAPMNRLPASLAEIADLPGKQFTDSQATKEQFLQGLNHYPIVHLATHAVADARNSSASYIAFYPATGIAAEDNLYLDELYGLNMDSTNLVIISACETGAGKLAGSEGVMSLSRGFTYAGCHAVINSLWKADDAATSAILKQFHVYLRKGFAKSKALQQAKLDYIGGNALHRTPDYWAHLILIGDTKPVAAQKSFFSFLLIMAPMAVLAVALGILVRRKK